MREIKIWIALTVYLLLVAVLVACNGGNSTQDPTVDLNLERTYAVETAMQAIAETIESSLTYTATIDMLTETSLSPTLANLPKPTSTPHKNPVEILNLIYETKHVILLNNKIFTFNNNLPSGWEYYKNGKHYKKAEFKNGLLLLEGTTGPNEKFQTVVDYTEFLNRGHGVIACFKYSDYKKLAVEMHLQTGQPNSCNYRTWGFIIKPESFGEVKAFRVAKTEGWEDNFTNYQFDNKHENLIAGPNTMFCAFVGLENDGIYVVKIWKKNNSKKNISYDIEEKYFDMTPWPETPWYFYIQVDDGELFLESVYLVEILP